MSSKSVPEARRAEASRRVFGRGRWRLKAAALGVKAARRVLPSLRLEAFVHLDEAASLGERAELREAARAAFVRREWSPTASGGES